MGTILEFWKVFIDQTWILVLCEFPYFSVFYWEVGKYSIKIRYPDFILKVNSW